MYVFEEFIRQYAIDCKGRVRKEVIYLYIADVSCTQGVCKSKDSPIEAPTVGFRDTTPPFIGAEL